MRERGEESRGEHLQSLIMHEEMSPSSSHLCVYFVVCLFWVTVRVIEETGV